MPFVNWLCCWQYVASRALAAERKTRSYPPAQSAFGLQNVTSSTNAGIEKVILKLN
jgi:hypothetical protein